MIILHFFRFIFLLFLATLNLFGICDTVVTEAKEPLKLVSDLCISDNAVHENFKNIHYSNGHLYVAKGAQGFDIVQVKFIDYPIENSIQLVKLQSVVTNADYIVADERRLYVADGSNLVVYSLSRLESNLNINITQTTNLNMAVTTMYSDDDYLYLGGNGKLKIFSKAKQSVIYEYNDIDGSVSSIFSQPTRVYVGTDANKIEVLAKNLIGNDLILAKVKYEGYEVNGIPANIFINNKNQISFASDGGYNLLSVYDFQAVNDKGGSATGVMNKYYHIDGFDIVSTSTGLYIENNRQRIVNVGSTFSDEFQSGDIDIFDEFVFAMDLNTDDAGNEEYILRAYKINSVGANSVFGYAPLTVDFRADTINVRQIEWVFENQLSNAQKNQFPSYTYQKAGAYNAIAIVTYSSGRSYRNYVHIVVEEILGFDFVITKDKYSGAAPFDIQFSVDIDEEIELSSIIWDFGDGARSFELNPKHTFEEAGDFDVSLTIINYQGVEVVKTTPVSIKTTLDGEIRSENVGNFAFINEDIRFYLSLTQPVFFTSYRWKIGKDTFDTQEVKYQFISTGKHTVELVTYDLEGVEHFFTGSIELLSHNKPLIKYTRTSGSAPLDLNLSLEIPFGVSYKLSHVQWKLPNKRLSYELEEGFTFTNEGNFKIDYEYRLVNGYYETGSIDVNVSNDMSLEVHSNSVVGLAPHGTSLYYSAVSDKGIKEYTIDFGDGSELVTTTKQNMAHIYEEDGDYLARVSVINNVGVSQTKSILISTIAIRGFVRTDDVDFDKWYENTELDLNFEILKTNNSYIYEYYWDFGDGSESERNELNVSHRYVENKSYTAKLKVVLIDESVREQIYFITAPIPPGNLQLTKGWNLIGNLSKTPIKKLGDNTYDILPNQNFLDIDLYSKASSIWIYQNGVWYNRPNYIDPLQGMWVNVKEDIKFPFYGKQNDPNLSGLPRGWHLLGTGVKLDNLTPYDFKRTIKYDNLKKEMIDSPQTIEGGEGFMIYKEE